MKITIIGITEHWEDEPMMHGDASHEGWASVNELYADEYRRKVENNEWDGLPFTCEADTIDEAIDQYNETVCECDYIKAVDADYETEDN